MRTIELLIPAPKDAVFDPRMDTSGWPGAPLTVGGERVGKVIEVVEVKELYARIKVEVAGDRLGHLLGDATLCPDCQ